MPGGRRRPDERTCLSAAGTAFALAVCGCGILTGDGGSGGDGGGGGALADVPPPVWAGAASSAAGAGGLPEAGPPNDVLDSGLEAPGGAGGQSPINPDCPVSSPILARDQTIVIQRVDFDRNEVTFVNATSVEQVLPAFWQWCSATTYAPPIYGFPIGQDAGALVLGPGDTITFNTFETAPTNLDLIAEQGEFALYDSKGGFQQAQNMESYVAWGVHARGRESVAVGREVWTFGERVVVEPGHSGFVLVGRTDRASGYQSVPRHCL